MSDVRLRARRAYERGRMYRALPWALPVAALAAAAALAGSHSAWFVGPPLAAGLVALLWRGGDAARGALAGLVAGAVPYLGIVLWSRFGTCGSEACVAVAVASGLGGTAALVHGLRTGSTAWTASALAVGAGMAMLPCWMLGAPGLLAAAALVAAGVPLAVLAPRGT